MSEVTTVQIDEQGRITIPKPVRQALGVQDEKAVLRLDIDVREVLDE